MLTIELNMYHAVALGAFLFWLGGVITDKVSLLNRYCIPAPLVGGLCFSILNCILYSMGIASINFDATLQTVFMIMFFTTVGFTVSIPALLKGGKAVILCLAISIVMIPLQNFLGGGVMALFGRDPLLGIGCGSIALVGGPGTAAAFGPDLEAADVVGGSVVSIAAATFGLVAGSLMGGPTAKRLIEKHDLRPASVTAGLTFPAYIGAMLVAVVVRNVMDGVHVSYPAEEIDTMGNMFLSIFLAMALAGLKLWELIDFAMPMVICLVLQCVVMFLFSYFVVFNVMGRNYDAAVMTAGFIGFAMGATSNAMANMQVVTKKYGPSPVAYFAIPMVGGMFIDFFNAVLIAANIGWWT